MSKHPMLWMMRTMIRLTVIVILGLKAIRRLQQQAILFRRLLP
jgi:hypothetical protein